MLSDLLCFVIHFAGFFLFDEKLPFCLDLIVVHIIPPRMLETNVGLELELRNGDAMHSFWGFAMAFSIVSCI